MKFILKNYEMLSRAAVAFSDFLKTNNVCDDCIFNCRLVISELVSNVFQHSNGEARLSGEFTGEDIIIKVGSDSAFRPPEKSVCSDAYAESGRGLFLIDCISEERSFTREGEIKVVLRAIFNN